MKNKEVQLKIHDLSASISPDGYHALVMEEVGGDRMLPLIIASHEAQAISMELKRYKSPRPFMHELMQNTLEKLGAKLEKVMIYKVKNGVYYSYLCMTDRDGNALEIDSRSTDAIVMALRTGCPICTTEEIIQENRMLKSDRKNAVFSVNVNMIDLEVLKDGLKRSVEMEDYENAAQLRDEIKRREAELRKENGEDKDNSNY